MHEGMRVSIKPQADTSDPSVIGQLRYLDDIRVSIDHNAPEVGDGGSPTNRWVSDSTL